MITPKFGQYGYVVLLQGQNRIIPFGIFQTKPQAQKWVETELELHEDETYDINYVRHVAG